MIVKIANEILDFESSNYKFYNERMKEYLYEGDAPPGVRIRSLIVDTIEKSEGKEIQCVEKNGMLSKVYHLGLSESEVVTLSRNGGIVSKVRFKNDYTDITISINARFRPVNCSIYDYEYLLTGGWFSNYLATRQGLMLHSSAIRYKDRAWLFSGNPGAGKSTHTGLWERYYEEEIAIINDDKPIIKVEDGRAYVYGTPWSGKTDKNSNISAELGDIFFVVKHRENKLEKISHREAIAKLFNQMQNPYYDQGLIDNNIAMIDKILREHEVFELKCDISADAVNTVKAFVDRKYI